MERFCKDLREHAMKIINFEEKEMILLTGLNHYDGLKAFFKYSNDMQDVYKNINEYNTDKECKILIVFDDMIADMINNKKLNSIVTNLLLEAEN